MLDSKPALKVFTNRKMLAIKIGWIHLSYKYKSRSVSGL